jgi:hypothetical protein
VDDYGKILKIPLTKTTVETIKESKYQLDADLSSALDGLDLNKSKNVLFSS